MNNCKIKYVVIFIIIAIFSLTTQVCAKTTMYAKERTYAFGGSEEYGNLMYPQKSVMQAYQRGEKIEVESTDTVKVKINNGIEYQGDIVTQAPEGSSNITVPEYDCYEVKIGNDIYYIIANTLSTEEVKTPSMEAAEKYKYSTLNRLYNTYNKYMKEHPDSLIKEFAQSIIDDDSEMVNAITAYKALSEAEVPPNRNRNKRDFYYAMVKAFITEENYEKMEKGVENISGLEYYEFHNMTKKLQQRVSDDRKNFGINEERKATLQRLSDLEKDENNQKRAKASEEETIAEDKKEREDKKKADSQVLYRWPMLVSEEEEEKSLDEMIDDAESFVSSSSESAIKVEDLRKMSSKIYNIALEIGVGIAVIVGLILGIKLMVSGVEEKAEYKKMLWVYVVGCMVTFGAFGIWKIVVSIIEQI